MSIGTTLQVYGFQQAHPGDTPYFELSPAILLHGDFQPLESILLRARRKASDRWYYVGEVAAQLIASAFEVNDLSAVRVLNQSGFIDDDDDFPCLLDISKPTWVCYCDRMQPKILDGLTIRQLDQFEAPDPDKPPAAATAPATSSSEPGPKRTRAARPARARKRD